MDRLSDFFNSQIDGPIRQETGLGRLQQVLLAAADPSPHSLDSVRLGPLVRATAGAGGGEQPGTRLGESRLGGAQQQKQHQYQTLRQQRDAKTGHIHCPSAESHLSCIAASSHPISLPWSSQRGVKQDEEGRNDRFRF